jgi:phospho-N-acetylmuramoyl-pentapeptide-transferase
MLLWLLRNVDGLAGRLGNSLSGDSQVYLTARTAGAALTAFLAAVLLGPVAIRWLKSRFREPIKSASEKLNALHAGKQDTPTMGGLFLVAAIVLTTLLFGDWSSPLVQLGLFVVVSFGLLGAADDWVKLRSRRRGISARQKLLAQVVLATIAGTWLYLLRRDDASELDVLLPVGDARWPLGVGFIAWAALVLVSSSNGVNLTDGLDGLASGCVVSCGTALAALTYLVGHAEFAAYLKLEHVDGCGEMSVLLGGVVGAVLGFLWYNAHPAQVFMGDTGSLPLGAILGVAALAARQELLLVVLGGVFVVETLSVILQVGCYKLTGRRPLACSPLHNHCVLRGHHEVATVTRFWIVGALLAIAGLALLRIR